MRMIWRLLDEPLSNLDAKLRTSMRTEIIKLHKKLATTFIYVTHDQTEAMTMGDRIVVMKDGIIQQVDTPQNLYDMPCNMFVAGFIGSPQMNFLDGTVTKNGDQYAIDLGGDTIPLPKEKTADGKLDTGRCLAGENCDHLYFKALRLRAGLCAVYGRKKKHPAGEMKQIQEI